MAESDRELEALFQAARRGRGDLPGALEARMLADAAAVRRQRAAASAGWWAQLRQALGGWYGLAGLAAACAAGVWIGFAPPAGLPDPAGMLAGTESGLDLYETEPLAMAMLEDM